MALGLSPPDMYLLKKRILLALSKFIFLDIIYQLNQSFCSKNEIKNVMSFLKIKLIALMYENNKWDVVFTKVLLFDDF